MIFAIGISRILNNATFSKLRSASNFMFRKHLLVTNIGISIGLSGVGDVIAQEYEIYQNVMDKLDRTRTTHMAISGLTVGLLTHNTYKILDTFFPGRGLKNVLKKVVLDQIIVSPICISLLFATIAVLERTDFEEFKHELIHKGWSLYFAELIIWPPAQLVNFFFLPPRFRVLYDNTISVGFDIYTSRVKHDIPTPERPQAR